MIYIKMRSTNFFLQHNRTCCSFLVSVYNIIIDSKYIFMYYQLNLLLWLMNIYFLFKYFIREQSKD